MVSTYLSYDLVNRDMKGSLDRIAKQTQVANDAKYYQENIGKVTTVDEFIDDYRLFSYAMSAHGLDEMIYAKAFMKQVLESDLSDENSFANRLADDRYKSFAAAFNFGATNAEAAVAQSSAQMDDVFGLYDQKIAALEEVSTEETRYFKIMLETEGHIKNVDEFLRNDRLREYMFSSYGIDGTYNNYNALRGVLTSDPDDPDSFYNTTYGNTLKNYDALRLEAAELLERDVIIKLLPDLEKSIEAGNEMKAGFQKEVEEKKKALEEPGADKEKLQKEIELLDDKIAAAQDLIDNDIAALAREKARLEELNGKLVPLEEAEARLLEINTELKAFPSNMDYHRKMQALAEDFLFNSDGTVPAGGALSDANIDKVLTGFFDSLTRTTYAEAMFNQEYFESKIATVTKIDDLLDDPRMYQYLRSAFNLDEAYIVKSTLDQILTSDLSDPDSVANSRPDRPGYLELAKAFNFNTDGTVKEGGLQTQQQASTTRNNYMSRWDDKQEENYEKEIKFYKSDMVAINTLTKFMSDDAKTTREFALKAVGIDPGTVSAFKLKSVLTSDLSDPNSYVYKLKDERFVSLAKLFNFTKDGDVTVPVLAQSNSTITNVASDYILRSTRFLKDKELEAAKATAEKEAKYYTQTMQGLDNRDQLLADRRLMDIILTAEGIDPKTITEDFLKQIFLSDINDPNSFVNRQEDKRFSRMVGSFNFDEKGEIDRSRGGTVQNGGEVAATHQQYLQQMLENQQGQENPGTRLALYFQRMADTITDPYVIIGDDALAEFFRITFSLPSEFSNTNVDQQAKVIEKHLVLEDLADPEKLRKLIERFTALYDIENNVGASSAAASILSGSGSMGISADTLWALSQIKMS